MSPITSSVSARVRGKELAHVCIMATSKGSRQKAHRHFDQRYWRWEQDQELG